MTFDAKGARRVLVVRVARIGDTLFVTPVLKALKAAMPGAAIDVLVDPKRRDALVNNPHVERLIDDGPLARLGARLKGSKPYDLALVYGHEAKHFRYARAVAGFTVGFEQKEAGLNSLLDLPVRASDRDIHAVDYALKLPAAIGAGPAGRGLVYMLTPEEMRWAEGFLASRTLGRGTIAMQVAGFPTKAYRDWPEAHYAALGRFVEKELGAGIVLLGDGKDRPKAVRIASSLKGAAVAAGETTLRQSGALIAAAAAFVTTDTGPMHLAFALRTPTVALFHCMHPGRWLGPLEDTHLSRLLQMEPPPGKACGREFGMESITPETVFASLKEILTKHEKV